VLGVSDRFCSPIVQVTPLRTPFGLFSLLFQSQSHVVTITNNYCLHCYPLHCWLATISVDYRLLTVDYFCWRWPIDSRRWPIDCGLSCFYLLLTSSSVTFFQLPSHCLKKGLAGPKWEHLPLLFIHAVCHSVTYETSVLLVRCVAAASF
jgi:hypothetical protein